MASTSTWALSVEGGEHKPIQFDQTLIDLWNIGTGWGKFDKDQAPKWVMDLDLSTPADNPGEGWGRGFAVYVYNSQVFGQHNVREFATTATGASMAMEVLYDEFEEQKTGHHRGELPIVQFSGVTPTKVGRGQTNVPQLHIVGWIPRPVDFPDQAPVPAGSSGTPSPAAAQPQQPINDGKQLF